ncbi:MAG: hypothetical protein N2038_14125, partial [Geminicoccaceae bacterium]|nr:hypothetical protein [Geminicoccaceae bacterium]
MVEVRCFVVTNDLVGLLESVDDGELISRDGSRIVGRLDSGLYAHLSGAFDFSSRPAFLASPLTRIEVTEDAEGRVPLISITGIEGRMRDLEIGLETLFAGRDRISGSSGDDVITFLDYPSFGIGDDTLRGGDGDDVLQQAVWLQDPVSGRPAFRFGAYTDLSGCYLTDGARSNG